MGIETATSSWTRCFIIDVGLEDVIFVMFVCIRDAKIDS